MDDEAFLPWPGRALPEISRCGLFPMEPDEFRTVYRSGTHALHLYFYHGAIRIGERVFRLRPGDVTLTPADTPSTYRLREPGRHWCAHFRPAPEESGEAVRLPLHIPLGAPLAYFRDRLKHVARLHNSPAAEPAAAAVRQAMASAAFLELLLELSELAAGQPARPAARGSDRALEELRDYVEEHLAEPLSVPGLASRVGLSQNYLARVFRRTAGTSLKGYLLLRRMEEARHLLAHTNLPVKAIAARVGFGDAQYFNKQFRRSAGLSPSAFRQRATGAE